MKTIIYILYFNMEMSRLPDETGSYTVYEIEDAYKKTQEPNPLLMALDQVTLEELQLVAYAVCG